MNRPYLVALCGIPGSGKSTFAGKLSKDFLLTYISINDLRRKIFPDPKFTQEEMKTAYLTMFEIGRLLLSAGRSVVLDATFSSEISQINAENICRETGAEFKMIFFKCPPGIARQRVKQKTVECPDYPDKDVLQSFDGVVARFHPLAVPHLTLDATAPVETAYDQIKTYVFDHKSPPPPNGDNYQYMENPIHMSRAQLVTEKVVKYSRLVKSDPVQILDIGLGCAAIEGFFQKLRPPSHRFHLTGLDVCLGPLQRALKDGLIDNVKQFDIEKGIPDFKTKFDIVICSETMEHFKYPLKTLKHNILPLLKPNGYFIGSVPNTFKLHDILGLLSGGFCHQLRRRITDEDFGHLAFFSLPMLTRDLLENAGLKVLEIAGSPVLLRRSAGGSSKLLAKLVPSLASHFVFVCKKPG